MPDDIRTPVLPFPRTVAHPLNAVLLGALLVGSAAAYDTLPDRIPVHFGFDGTPDRWADRSMFSWMVLPFIALFVSAVTYGSAWFIGRRPGSMNMPDRKRYEALPLSAQRQVAAVVQRSVCWLTVFIVAAMAAAQWGAWHVAVGRSDGLPPWSLALVILLIVSSPLTTVYLVLRTGNLVNRLSKPPA